MRQPIVVGLLLAGIGCDGGGVNSGGGPHDDMGDYFPHGILECASPDGSGECVLDFGEALAGIPAELRTIGLCNRGNEPAVLSHLTTAPPFAGRRQASSIAPGACVDDALVVSFAPDRAGTFDERLTAYDLDGEAVEVRLLGTAATPWFQCTPETISSVLPVDGEYLFATICRNMTTVALHAFAGIVSDDADEFSLRQDGGLVEPGAGVTFSMQFRPSRMGPTRAVLAVKALGLDGDGPAVPVASVLVESEVVADNLACQGDLDFGDVSVGSSLTRTLRCTNGTDTWARADYEILGSSSPAFAVGGPGELELPPRGQDGSPSVFDLEVTFAPPAAGPATGSLAFSRGAEDMAIFPLRGNGI